jgi:KaiC/GvpD/RAD55 family RecA-like ATPase
VSGRLRSGNDHLDEVLGGGLPANGISLITGLPGVGKTIVAEQYVFRNASPDRPAVYLSTASEPLEKIVRFGQSLDFFDTAAIGTSVFYEDLGVTVSRRGLPGVTDQIGALLKERRPGLIVIDSFKALQTFAEGSGGFRKFLHELTGLLTAVPVSALWIGEYDEPEIPATPEFAVADAIVNLAAVRVGNREARLLNVSKIRGSGFLSGLHVPAQQPGHTGIPAASRRAAAGGIRAGRCARIVWDHGARRDDGGRLLAWGPPPWSSARRGPGRRLWACTSSLVAPCRVSRGSSRPRRKIARSCGGWRKASDGRWKGRPSN